MKKIYFQIFFCFVFFLNTIFANDENSNLEKALKIGDNLSSSWKWECEFAKNRTDKFKYNCQVPLMFTNIMSGFDFHNFSAKNTIKLWNIHHSNFVQKITWNNGKCPDGKVVKWFDIDGKIICDFNIWQNTAIKVIEWNITVTQNGKKENLSENNTKEFFGKLIVENKDNKPASIQFLSDNSVLRLESKTKIRLDTDNHNKPETSNYKKISDVLVYNGVIWGRILSPVNIGNGEIVAWVRGTSFLWEQKERENPDYFDKNIFLIENNNSSNFLKNNYIEQNYLKNNSQTARVTVFDSQNPDNAMEIWNIDRKNLQSPDITIPENNQIIVTKENFYKNKNQDYRNSEQSLLIENQNQNYKKIFQEKTKKDIAYLNNLQENKEIAQKNKEIAQNEINSTNNPCKEDEKYFKDSPIENLVCIENNVIYFAYIKSEKPIYFDINQINNKEIIVDRDWKWDWDLKKNWDWNWEKNKISLKAWEYYFENNGLTILNNGKNLKQCNNNDDCYYNGNSHKYNGMNLSIDPRRDDNKGYLKIKNPNF